MDSVEFLTRPEHAEFFSPEQFGIHNYPDCLQLCDNKIGICPAHLADPSGFTNAWMGLLFTELELDFRHLRLPRKLEHSSGLVQTASVP